jgi:hypothetical protein
MENLKKYNEFINESKDETLASWFNENKEKLKEEYIEYKKNFKLDKGTPKKEMLSNKEWAKEKYNSL